MARITVEDCLENVDNRFQLVLTAAKRARQLANGKPPTLEWEKDKVTVMALREIAEGNITSAILDEVEQVEEVHGDFFGMDETTGGTATSSGTETNQAMSSDELLASQVEALLAASNDEVISSSESEPVIDTPKVDNNDSTILLNPNSESGEVETP